MLLRVAADALAQCAHICCGLAAVPRLNACWRESHIGLSMCFVKASSSVQVIDNEICYKWKEYRNVFQVFGDRTKMHQEVYHHR